MGDLPIFVAPCQYLRCSGDRVPCFFLDSFLRGFSWVSRRELALALVLARYGISQFFAFCLSHGWVGIVWASDVGRRG